MASPGRRNEVFLLGDAPPTPPDSTESPPGDKIKIGTFAGPWAPTAIAWLDSRTVEVCPLAADPTARTTVSLLVTPQTHGVFHVVTHCPRPSNHP